MAAAAAKEHRCLLALLFAAVCCSFSSMVVRFSSSSSQLQALVLCSQLSYSAKKCGCVVLRQRHIFLLRDDHDWSYIPDTQAHTLTPLYSMGGLAGGTTSPIPFNHNSLMLLGCCCCCLFFVLLYASLLLSELLRNVWLQPYSHK